MLCPRIVSTGQNLSLYHSLSLRSLLIGLPTDDFWDEDALRWDLNTLFHKRTH